MSRNAYRKSQIILLEFIIVVLFFSICAAICVSAFVKADYLSASDREKNRTLIVMESAAACVKSVEGNNAPEEAGNLLEKQLGAVVKEDGQGQGATYVIHCREKFEKVQRGEKTHPVYIHMTFENNMLTAKIEANNCDPLIVKKYISVKE
ncbi:MAG: hypothetical protein RRY25_06885 [Anaerovorax sp.]